MKIIAKVDFSAQLKAGGSYELPESDAKMLIAAGLATAAPPEDAPTRAPRGRYQRRDLRADDAPPE